MQIAQRLPFRWEPKPRPHLTVVPAPEPPRASARRSTPSQDVALYKCGCGYAFTAAVTTTVGCPNCAATQAW